MKLEGESLRLKVCPVGNCVTQPCLRSITHTPVIKTKSYFFPLSVPICLSLRRRHNISQRGVGGETYTVSDGESETKAWMNDIASFSWNVRWLFDRLFLHWERRLLKVDLNNNNITPRPTHHQVNWRYDYQVCLASPDTATDSKHYRHVRHSRGRTYKTRTRITP